MLTWINNLGKKFQRFAPLVMRLGLAIVFLLFAYQKLSLSTASQGSAEIQLLFSLGIGPAAAINFYVGLLEIFIGIFLLSGFQVRIAGLIASGMVFFIFIAYLRQQGLSIQPDLYRDLGLSAMGFALFLLGNGKPEQTPPSTPQQ
ncbi:MAG: DoxX family protein [Patescibacteria group bacterium]